MQEVEVVRRFAAPPQAVWDVYVDHARWQEWAGVGRSVLQIEGQPERNGAGAVRVLGPWPGRATEEVVEFEPPKRMTYRVVKGGLPMRDHLGEVRFEPDGGGTRVVWRCRFESRIPGAGGLMRRAVTKVFRDALEGLARHHFPD
ncbi:MAG: SRPBCC family protein [Myxococcota bacterium]|nr:SRPBCC family protein [Myxococcota bacterium]